MRVRSIDAATPTFGPLRSNSFSLLARHAFVRSATAAGEALLLRVGFVGTCLPAEHLDGCGHSVTLT